MTESKTPAQEMISLLEKNNQLLEAVLEQLGEIAQVLKESQPLDQSAPNYKQDIKKFNTFDWARIGATVEQSDNHGVAVVSWRDNLFVRRSAQNKFGPAIWFSRCTGKDEEGENVYERLVTFKAIPDRVAEPLPDKALNAMGG